MNWFTTQQINYKTHTLLHKIYVSILITTEPTPIFDDFTYLQLLITPFYCDPPLHHS